MEIFIKEVNTKDNSIIKGKYRFKRYNSSFNNNDNFAFHFTKTIFLNKKILILLFFSFFILLFNNNVFGYTAINIEDMNNILNDDNIIADLEENGVDINEITGCFYFDKPNFGRKTLYFFNESSTIQLNSNDSFICTGSLFWNYYDNEWHKSYSFGSSSGGSLSSNSTYFSTEELSFEDSVIFEDLGNVKNGVIVDNNSQEDNQENTGEDLTSNTVLIDSTQYNSLVENINMLNQLELIQVMFLFTIFLYLFIHFAIERRKF